MGRGVGRAVFIFSVLGTGGGCVVGKKGTQRKPSAFDLREPPRANASFQVSTPQLSCSMISPLTLTLPLRALHRTALTDTSSFLLREQVKRRMDTFSAETFGGKRFALIHNLLVQ